LCVRETGEPFDLERGPLLRVRAIDLGEGSRVLLVTAHHIIADGWSTGVILSQLAEEYSRLVGKQVGTGEPAFGFSSYAAWLDEPAQKSSHAEALAYWQRIYEGGVPVLELPTDYSRPSQRSYACDTILHELDPGIVSGMKKVGAASRCTFFVTLLTAFSIFLRRISGQSELVIGVPAAGQAAAGQPGLVGHCTNMLPLRVQTCGRESFFDSLQRERSAVLDAFEHQQCTFTELLPRLKLERDASRVPLISVTFNVDRILRGLRFGDMDAGLAASPRRFDNFEWTFNLIEAGNEAKVELTFNASLFARETMQRRLQEFERLLTSIVANPASPVDELDMLGPVDRQLQLDGWNETGRPYPQESIAEYLQRGFAEPSAEALTMDGVHLRYAELESRSNRLAHYLRAQGARRGDLVGLSLARSPEMVVALLGILKSGAAYLPLDPAFPAERLKFMLEDSGAGLLVTETALLSSLPAFAGNTVCVDRDEDLIAAQSAAPLPESPGPDDRAYVIYTSGSTGKPKGVQVLQRNVVNFLQSMARQPGIGKEDRLLAVTTLSFDISVLELLLPLSVGATVVLASREASADGLQLRELLETGRISLMQATPSTWRLLLAAGWQGDGQLKVLCGGEALPRDLAEMLHSRCGELWNLYGPTETTVWSTVSRLYDADAPVLIGRPIDNTRVYVLDEQRQPLPLGVYGELYIGGAGVTGGYLNRPELTAERFVADPFVAGERLYRTGDRVRYRADGSLEYHSRIDNQVKVRGFRIELGEIEAALSAHPALQEAAVMVREDQPGDQRLVAYYVVTEGQPLPTASELRSHLRLSLPDYMLPQHFRELPELPRTPNNKLDRKALPGLASNATQASAREHVEPTTPTEKAVAALWQEILRDAKIGADDNFFELGGHSLASVQVIAWAKRTYSVALHPLSLVTDSLARIAQEIDRQSVPPGPEKTPRRKSFTSRVIADLKSALRPAPG
jgi:amino acid adenylation domain-containing protein